MRLARCLGHSTPPTPPGVSAERVRAFALGYDCDDEPYVEALAAMTAGRSRNWWDDYRALLPPVLLDLSEMEEHATALRTVQFTHLPGLLQTPDYGRLVFQQNVPALSPPSVEHRLSHRIKRQGVLYTDRPTPYTGIIHEAALRMQFGDPEVMRNQLAHIAEMSEREHVTVLVLPFAAGIFPGAGQTVVIAEGPHPRLDTVQLDTEHSSEFLHAEAQLVKYRTIMGRMEDLSLGAGPSRDLIHALVANL